MCNFTEGRSVDAEEEIDLVKSLRTAHSNHVDYEMKDGININPLLLSSKEKLANTELVIDCVKSLNIKTPWEYNRYPAFGNNVLLMVPTSNKFKVELLTKVVQNRLTQKQIARSELGGANLIVIKKPAQSDVNEQPYNGSGVRGALNRIKHGMDWLDSSEGLELLKTEKIGTIIIASIENYIELEPKGNPKNSPADFGAVVVSNATQGTCQATLSRGVTVPKKYVLEAMRYGFEPEAQRYGSELYEFPSNEYDLKGGNVTVGKVIAAHADQVPNDDWLGVVSGTSRYILLEEAANEVKLNI